MTHRRKRGLHRIVPYPIDLLPAGIVLGVFALQLWIFFRAPNLGWASLGAALLFPVQLNFAGVCHNHHHLNTFGPALLNRLFEIVMFLQVGMLPYGYCLHHNIGHHRNYRTPERDPNRWTRPDGSTKSRFEFAWTLFLGMYPTVFRVGSEHPVLLRRFLWMAGACAAVLGALLWIDPLRALVMFVLPLPPALLLTADATFEQHRDLHSKDPYAASRSDERFWYNLRTCNLGYHTAHHLRPGLHWSRLPAFHARIRHRLPGECLIEEASANPLANAHTTPNQSPHRA